MMTIEEATMAFRELLVEQRRRIERLEQTAAPRTDDAVTTIGLVPGDGIGPMIVAAAEQVLRRLLATEIAAGRVVLTTIEGLTIERRLACGQSVPDEVLAAIKNCDVILKGPTTTPMGGTMESANVTLRRELDLAANVRPVKIPSLGIDWTFFRENTEGEYALGSRGVELEGMAVDFKVTSDFGTRRIVRAAFEYARQNGKHRVTVVTKANILKKTDGKFAALAHAIAQEYPGIVCDDRYVDIMSAEMLDPAKRTGFEVIVTPNLYGDILTDEAAQIQGGVGTAGSGNLGSRHALFEAIHGSAPRLIEAGLGDYANPASILRATVMLLRHIGRQKAAGRLERALDACAVVVDGTREGATCAEYVRALDLGTENGNFWRLVRASTMAVNLV